jgi:hypothetical protein
MQYWLINITGSKRKRKKNPSLAFLDVTPWQTAASPEQTTVALGLRVSDAEFSAAGRYQ